MEENQIPNPGQQFNNVTGEPKKKKSMGPVKGIIVALILAIIVIAIGFLIRMLVQGDGDYFLPFKQMFGIEEEEGSTSKKKSKKTTNTVEEPEEEEEEGQKEDPLGGKYTLLSEATSGAKVEHYRISMDMGKMLKQMLKEIDTDDLEKIADKGSELSSGSSSGKSEQLISSITDSMGMVMMVLNQFSDVIDGEMYFDIYFEGNDLIQIVMGYEYDKLLTKLYSYMKQNSPDTLTEQGIKSADDLGKYLKDTLDTNFNEDAIYEMIADKEETKKQLDEYGISKKDITDAVDFVNEEGLFEVYINGTTKLKGLISLVLGTKDVKDGLKQVESQYGIKIDPDNIFSSLFKSLGDVDEIEELEDYGMSFVKIK